MTTRNSNPSHWYQRAAIGLSLLTLTLAAVLGSATPASALLAGGAKIINTASVDWDGNGAPITASVTVTVNTVYATPVVGTDATDTTITSSSLITGEHVAHTLNFYITNKSTGLESITLSDNNVLTDVTAADAYTAISSPIALGATVASAGAAAGTAVLTVPSDGTSDGTVNGITENDYIVIGSTIYRVAVGGVTDNATTNVATITLTSNLTAPVPAGTQIGERGLATVAITTGAITPATLTEGNYAVTVTSTSPGAGTSATGTHTVIVRKAALSIVKEVKVGTADFTTGPATAAPGATLTYRITVTNTGTAAATNVQISDSLPAYTSYLGNPRVRVQTDPQPANEDYTTAAAAGAGYSWVSPTATYDVASLDAAGGNDVLILYFQVTIDNP